MTKLTEFRELDEDRPTCVKDGSAGRRMGAKEVVAAGLDESWLQPKGKEYWAECYSNRHHWIHTPEDE